MGRPKLPINARGFSGIGRWGVGSGYKGPDGQDDERNLHIGAESDKDGREVILYLLDDEASNLAEMIASYLSLDDAKKLGEQIIERASRMHGVRRISGQKS